ncbi:MAG: DUF924 domain-containing protein [Alphaproteobacteria bacterium]|nr:DUF924 family protein [Alphaproteobacteria bacterium]TAD86956.1 MAG: DUF924 domain-containing protein [Alphaproteobacteria bacterium]
MSPAAILDFWFGPPPHTPRQVWFEGGAAFDSQVRAVWADPHALAASGVWDGWAETPEGALALVLLLDQAPRHLFRGSPQAFASDAKALAIAQRHVEAGTDRALSPIQRWFFYLPWQHSESPTVQAESVALHTTLAGEPWADMVIDFARRHAEVVLRFGHFPHRNRVLGRPTTEAEAAFLVDHPGGF